MSYKNRELGATRKDSEAFGGPFTTSVAVKRRDKGMVFIPFALYGSLKV